MIDFRGRPTFYLIYKKKSTEGFQSVPYVVALFSAMLWIFYAFLDTDASLLITINSIGCFIETAYIVVFIVYATKQARVRISINLSLLLLVFVHIYKNIKQIFKYLQMVTMKLVFLLNICGFGCILILTLFLVKGANRIRVLGWICLVFSLIVFIAPLCIIVSIFWASR